MWSVPLLLKKVGGIEGGLDGRLIKDLKSGHKGYQALHVLMTPHIPTGL